MPFILLILFIAVPILEVSVIGRVQELLGWPLTVGLLAADSLLGAMLVRQEGTRAWRRFTSALSGGQPPATEVIDGALILFGGALLLTPGFVTDLVGLLCVLGPTRTIIKGVLLRRFTLAAGPLGALFMVNRQPRTRRQKGSGPPGRDDAGPALGGDTRRQTPPVPPPKPGVIDVEVVEVKRNRPRDPDA